MDAGGETGLRATDWAPRYSHEDGDLVKLFYTPALSCSRLYQRVTGYFSGDVLALAARGLDALIGNRGRMQLIVGCTLQGPEILQIEQGYDLREQVSKGLIDRLQLSAENARAREQIGWLAWMVAAGHLDIKVAVPKDAEGKFRAGLGLYHAKCGILVDEAGDRLVFEGSINETVAGWLLNGESFAVSCSWAGGRDLQRIESLEREFAKLWANRARSAAVLEFPEACKQKLLEFLPEDDRFFRPHTEEGLAEPAEAQEAVSVSDEDRCREVWSFIANAPKRPDGALVAVRTSTVDPWPHQLRAYRRMLDAWPCRLLIADEVGLGKTIEAGLLLRHAWISGKARRILVLVPKAVLRQWQAELYEKFNLLVPIYAGDRLVWPEHHFRQGKLEQDVARDEWTRTPIVLASSHLMRRADRQGDLLSAEDWDLIVLDEAHHARRKGATGKKDKGPNRLLALMEKLAEKTESLLLLTATPMQVDPGEIWELVRLLGLPPEWTVQAFRAYFENLAKNPDPKEVQRLARLMQACERTYGPLPEAEIARVVEKHGLAPIRAEQIMRALREEQSTIPLKRLSATELRAAIAILRSASPLAWRMSRHTRSLLREYHRRGLLSSPIAERKVSDIAIELAQPERRLYDAVEDYISETYKAAAASKKSAVGFVMTVYRQRLSSSFHALRKTLNRRLEQLAQGEEAPLFEEEWEEAAAGDDARDEALDSEDVRELLREADQVEEEPKIRGLLREIARLGTDTKARRLCAELRRRMPEPYPSAIVFTQFADTMEYLRELLAEQFDVAIGTYSGAGGSRRDHSGQWVRVSKEEIKRLLRQGKIQLLVCTDAAGEGLNLQTCGLLVNYDLPWNPMKVEQRIGRIDRIGQKHREVTILNLAYQDTVEADVYFTLSKRIGLFQGVVGKLQPILSQVARQLEGAVLGGGVDQDRARSQTVGAVDQLIDQAQAASFDIDEVSEADLRAPEFPPAPLAPEDIDRVLQRPELLPRGVELRRLELWTYAVTLPGSATPARITALPAIFEEHFESHQLLTADSPLFERFLELAGVDRAGGDSSTSGKPASLSELLEPHSSVAVTGSRSKVN